MKQAQDILTINTRRRGHHNVTGQLSGWLSKQGVATGLATVLVQHVRASLTIRDNVDRDDLHTFFNTLEGADSPAGDAAPLYATQVAIPVREGRMALGPRQGLFLYEDRDGPQTRSLVVHLIGE